MTIRVEYVVDIYSPIDLFLVFTATTPTSKECTESVPRLFDTTSVLVPLSLIIFSFDDDDGDDDEVTNGMDSPVILLPVISSPVCRCSQAFFKWRGAPNAGGKGWETNGFSFNWKFQSQERGRREERKRGGGSLSHLDCSISPVPIVVWLAWPVHFVLNSDWPLDWNFRCSHESTRLPNWCVADRSIDWSTMRL